MVTIKIVVEGGIMPDSNNDALTIANSNRLRESFHKLLSQVVDEDTFNLEIEMGAGEKNACKMFKHSVQHSNCFLLIDLDKENSQRQTKLDLLGIEDYSSFVFFMIQKMEAWILSQPKAIEKVMESYNVQKRNKSLKDDPVFEKKAYDIAHPDKRLNTILSRYFFIERRGKVKKAKYGKLKDAPAFIASLNALQLKDIFEDVSRLFDYIKSYTEKR
ncbi:MAG: hypothetical protein ACEPOV_06140 [Hyphomicrobiales bacterium]